MDLEKLKVPFSADEIEWRIAQSGKNGTLWAYCLAYISARAILDRLDQVCGPENWKVSYEFVGTTGVMCNLSIRCAFDPITSEFSEWVTKSDGAEMTDIEAFKGGISSALKRAGSAWGIGRYLYSLETGKALIVERGSHPNAKYGKLKDGTAFYWLPPELPLWALPNKEFCERTGSKELPTNESKLPTLPPLSEKPNGVFSSKLSQKQVDRLWAIANSKSVSKGVVYAKLVEMGVGSEFDLTKGQYDLICNEWLPDQSKNRVPGPVVAPKSEKLGMIPNILPKMPAGDYEDTGSNTFFDEPPDWAK